VPAIWPLEVANVLLVSERRQRLTQAQTTRFVELLQALPITVDRGQKGLDSLLALGREHKLSAYDAAYLELATRLGLALATQDARLSAAAIAIGVSLVE
jgi:predicted nucleic acid-binding protein